MVKVHSTGFFILHALNFFLNQKPKYILIFQLQLGCPEGDINVMEEVEVNSEEESTEELKESNFSLDARAGNVDVFLPPIKFNAIAIADHLTALRKHKNTKTKARKRLTDIINK